MEILEPALAQAIFPGPVNLFIGFFLILSIYTGAMLFTYWISKDE